MEGGGGGGRGGGRGARDHICESVCHKNMHTYIKDMSSRGGHLASGLQGFLYFKKEIAEKT